MATVSILSEIEAETLVMVLNYSIADNSEWGVHGAGK